MAGREEINVVENDVFNDYTRLSTLELCAEEIRDNGVQGALGEVFDLTNAAFHFRPGVAYTTFERNMSALPVILFAIVFIGVLAVLAARILFSDAICRPAIRDWATKENVDYAIDDRDWIEECFDRGPFLFRMTGAQRVYRLLITQEGQVKIAYVRVGHWLLGLLHPVVAMRWKEPNQSSQTTTGSSAPDRV